METITIKEAKRFLTEKGYPTENLLPLDIIQMYTCFIAELPKPEKPIIGDLWRDEYEIKTYNGMEWV